MPFELYIPVDTTIGFVPLFFIGLCYGYILMKGANMIKDGSELLLLIPAFAGIVGPVVLPVLGAVPDGAIVLFSGLGEISAAKERIAVGVGALAGSTIMLLTVPWVLALVGGRVNLDPQGKGNYIRPSGAAGRGWKKLNPPCKLLGTGVNVDPSIKRSAVLMMVTALPLLVVQIAAAEGHCVTDVDIALNHSTAHHDACHTPKWSTLTGFILCFTLFVFYLYLQLREGKQDAVVKARLRKAREKAMSQGLLSFRVLFQQILADSMASQQQDGTLMSTPDGALSLMSLSGGRSRGGSTGAACSRPSEQQLRQFLLPTFRKYDLDGNGTIDRAELKVLLESLHEPVDQLEELMAVIDTDQSGTIDFDEFVSFVCLSMQPTSAAGGVDDGRSGTTAAANNNSANQDPERQPLLSVGGAPATMSAAPPDTTGTTEAEHHTNGDANERNTQGNNKRYAVAGTATGQAVADAASDNPDLSDEDSQGEENEEEESMPDDLVHLSPKKQRRKILWRSTCLMFCGTALVLLFSDPMVDVLNTLGIKTHIPPFFVAFVLAPLVSNGSELVAAYSYAKKKTVKSITISFSTLLGAANMNNTFCSGIFIALVYFRGFQWEYAIETISILLVEVIMFFTAYFMPTMKTWVAGCVLMMLPQSLVIVYMVHHFVKWG